MHSRGVRLLALTLGVAAFAGMGTRPAAQQQPTTVRGRVEIGTPVARRRPASAYPTRAVPGSPLAPPSEVRHVVVYLKDAPARTTAPTRVEIVQRNETFVPRVVAVPAGSAVAFPNSDPIYHNVFSLSRAKAFNLGRYPRGQSKEERFDTPGIIRVFCDIHSHMSATVMVFSHPWFAIPDEEGRFELAGVPPGDRDVVAWHERLGETPLRLRVEAGRATAADFTLPVPPQ